MTSQFIKSFIVHSHLHITMVKNSSKFSIISARFIEKRPYNIWRIISDQMERRNRNQTSQKQQQAPKRSLISYLCPCFNFSSNHSLKAGDKLRMNNTEQSQSTLPFDQTKPKQSITQAPIHPHDSIDPLHKILKNNEQSGIYIKFKENQSDKEQKSEYDNMQEEYQKYLRQQSKPKPRFYPINTLKENHLIVVGTNQGKILCKIKSVYLEPSQSAQKKQSQVQKHKDKCSDPVIQKFWDKRYFLFQKFDQGIKLDQQSWFSVTPQAVAEHIASRLTGCENVLDGFCGAGGDSIKLALNCNRVVSNDIDHRKVKLLENNAAIYGVDNIETMVTDFFQLQFKRNQFDAVYMSPPWGGPEYYKIERMLPQDFIPPLDSIISKSLGLSDNIVLLLPNNTDIESIPPLIAKAFQQQKVMGTCSMQLQKIYFEGYFKFIALYIGSRISKISLSDELQYIYRLLSDGHGPFRYKRVIKKVREQIGMMKLLNLIFKCQKDKTNQNVYQKLMTYLKRNEIITEQKLLKLEQMDENDTSRFKQGKKQKKMQKKLIKSQRQQKKPSQYSNVNATNVEIRASQSIDSPSKKQKLDQTNSYVSSISESQLANSFNNNNAITQSIDKSGVKIEELIRSKIPKE